MATKKKGLGKGLAAIFGDDVVNESRQTVEERNVSRETSDARISSGSDGGIYEIADTDPNQLVMEKGAKYRADKVSSKEEPGKEYMVKLALVEPNREQPRKNFDKEQISELADSVKKYGILQPLLVQKKGTHYEIIAGERRWRAAREAGLKEVPVVVKEYSRQQAMEISLIENVQRADLNPVEEAQAYQQLMQEFDLTQEEIAERVSKNRTTITNSLRLLKLDKRVLELLVQNQITGGHARALLGLEDGEQQYQAALKIVGEKLSVRDAEKLVKVLNKPPRTKKGKEEEKDISFIFRDLEERMKQAVGTKVTINRRDRNKGKVEIEYYSQAELERIVELLESLRDNNK